MDNLRLSNYLAGPQFQNRNRMQAGAGPRVQATNFPQPVAPMAAGQSPLAGMQSMNMNSGMNMQNLFQNLFQRMNAQQQPAPWGSMPSPQNPPALPPGAVDITPILQQLRARFQGMQQQPTSWPATPTPPQMGPNMGTGQPMSIQPFIQSLLARLLSNRAMG